MCDIGVAGNRSERFYGEEPELLRSEPNFIEIQRVQNGQNQ